MLFSVFLGKINLMRRLILFSIIFFTGIVTFAQHTVILQTGEKLKGVVMEIKHDTLMVVIKRQMTEIPLVEVSSIFFNEHVAYDGSFDPNEKEKSIKSGDYLIKYVMKDRKITTPPVISNATETKGTVVVNVTIDRYGIVHTSKAGAPGSTTSSEYLYIKAEYAAKSTRFNEHLNGPHNTKGTIIITY